MTLSKPVNRLIDIAKEQVAKEWGFDNMFGTHWKTAMMYTHRTKRQILMYEQVLDLMGGALEEIRRSK